MSSSDSGTKVQSSANVEAIVTQVSTSKMARVLVLVSVLVLVMIGFLAFALKPSSQRWGAEHWSASLRGKLSKVFKTSRERDGNREKIEKDGQKIFNWVKEHGGDIGDVKISVVQKGHAQVRGVVAVADIPKDTTIFKVPRSVFLAGDDTDFSQYGVGPEPSTDLLLALRIAEERRKGSESMWADYLAVLPSPEEYADFHPLFSRKDDMDLFPHLPTVSFVRERRKMVFDFFKKLHIDRAFAWEDFWLSYVTYISRSHGITITNKKGKKQWMPVTVPSADFANTATPNTLINTEWHYDAGQGYFKVVTTKPIRTGEEIFESYQISSLKDNAYLAFMFGFVLPGNPKQVKQLSASQCNEMLSHPVALIKSKKVRELLFSLAIEHCEASGESSKAIRARTNQRLIEEEGKLISAVLT